MYITFQNEGGKKRKQKRKGERVRENLDGEALQRSRRLREVFKHKWP